MRDAAGVVQGFSSLCQPQDISRSLLRSDPVTTAWMEHLRRAPVPARQRVLFNRHALASGDTATATLWLDAKRAYLELRPHLRRLYTPVPNADRALIVLAPLGFAALPGAPVQIGQDAHWTLVNDFGPGSIDGWLSEVVAVTGALAAATRANAEQIAEVTLASVARVGATLSLSQEGAGDRGSWFRR